MPAATKTRTDVELVSVGTWAASTGQTTVTRADLESMLAAHDDGLVDRAPLKLGHVSDLNKGIGDGNPAYGWVIPRRIATGSNGADTLFGDIVGMPAMLSDIADTAFRRRSVEIMWGVKTKAGKAYRAVLSGLALLGAQAPAVKGLADIVALYSAPLEVTEATTTIDIVAGLEANPVASAMLAAAARAGLEPTILDSMTALAGDTPVIPPVVTAPGNDEPVTPSAGGTPMTTTTTAPAKVTLTDDELRKALGLEADADVAKALEALTTERAASADATGKTPAEADTKVADAPVVDPAPVTPAAPATKAPETVQLSAEVYSQLTALAARDETSRRDAAVDTAIRTGRIVPAERKTYRDLLDSNEAAGTALLAGLAPKFSVVEHGIDTDTHLAASSTDVDKAWEAWETGASEFPGR